MDEDSLYCTKVDLHTSTPYNHSMWSEKIHYENGRDIQTPLLAFFDDSDNRLVFYDCVLQKKAWSIENVACVAGRIKEKYVLLTFD